MSCYIHMRRRVAKTWAVRDHQERLWPCDVGETPYRRTTLDELTSNNKSWGAEHYCLINPFLVIMGRTDAEHDPTFFWLSPHTSPSPPLHSTPLHSLPTYSVNVSVSAFHLLSVSFSWATRPTPARVVRYIHTSLPRDKPYL